VGALAFCAYPSGFQIVQETVTGIVEGSLVSVMSITPWEKMQTIGLKLDDHIRDQTRRRKPFPIYQPRRAQFYPS
jgi:hypothetical protein